MCFAKVVQQLKFIFSLLKDVYEKHYVSNVHCTKLGIIHPSWNNCVSNFYDG